MNAKAKELVAVMSEEDIHTISYYAKKLNVSHRSISNYLIEIETYLACNGIIEK